MKPLDGTLTFDIVIGGVRIQKRSGTDDPKVVEAIKATLRKLHKQGRSKMVDAVRLGTMTGLQVYQLDLAGELDSFSGTTDVQRLKTVTEDGVSVSSPMLKWLDSNTELAETTKDGYRSRFYVFLRTVPHTAKVKDLPALLEAFKSRYADKPRSFNETKAAVQSYLSATLNGSQVYKEVTTIPAYGKKHFARYAPVRNGRPLTVQQVVELCERMKKADTKYHYEKNDPRHGGGTKAAQMFWTLCLTGMLPKEYYEDGWKVDRKGSRVVVMGQKREQRTRYVPLIDSKQLTKPLLNLKHFSKYVGLASNGNVLLKDARNTFIKWCVDNVPYLRAQYYAGHQPKSMTMYYAQGQGPTKEEVQTDSQTLRTYIDGLRVVADAKTNGLAIIKSGTPFVGKPKSHAR